jgi:hypothetical protein
MLVRSLVCAAQQHAAPHHRRRAPAHCPQATPCYMKSWGSFCYVEYVSTHASLAVLLR